MIRTDNARKNPVRAIRIKKNILAIRVQALDVWASPA